MNWWPCCCECACCNGATKPEQYEVWLQFLNVSGDCTCSDMNGTYYPDLIDDSAGDYAYSCNWSISEIDCRCVWLDDWQSYSEYDCDITQYRVGVHIYRHIATDTSYVCLFVEFDTGTTPYDYAMVEEGIGNHPPDCSLLNENVNFYNCNSADCRIDSLNNTITAV